MLSEYMMRYKTGEERRTPKGQFPTANNTAGDTCGECFGRIEPDDAVTLFAVGPLSRSAAQKADAGSWYTALAVVMHERCAWEES